MRFNTGLSTNARLRTLIDHLRQEKQVFEGLQKKLQRVRAYASYCACTNLFIYKANCCSHFILGADRFQKRDGGSY